MLLICGFFRASYGVSLDLFTSLAGPIVEQFDASDQLDQKMKAALGELVAQEVGMGVMTAAYMKQVLVALVRRSLKSSTRWIERFSMWGDPQIARAFSEMAARPGAPHTVQSLSQKVGLSRTVFMARFAATFGVSPSPCFGSFACAMRPFCCRPTMLRSIRSPTAPVTRAAAASSGHSGRSTVATRRSTAWPDPGSIQARTRL